MTPSNETPRTPTQRDELVALREFMHETRNSSVSMQAAFIAGYRAASKASVPEGGAIDRATHCLDLMFRETNPVRWRSTREMVEHLAANGFLADESEVEWGVRYEDGEVGQVIGRIDLAKHDAEVTAEALREAAQDAYARGDIGKEGGDEAWTWLRARADLGAQQEVEW